MSLSVGETRRALGLLAACLALSAAAAAAAPSATLTITEGNRTASATGGPFFVPNESYTESFVLGQAGDANSDSFICDALANPCFEVQVEVVLPADYPVAHPTDRIRITLGWDPQASDLDMHVYTPPYNTASGSPFRSSRNNPPTPEVVEFPAASGSFRVYGLPAIPAAVSATVTASLVEGPVPTETPTVRLGGPTFANYQPPAGLTTFGADEPTMGVNLRTNSAYMLFRMDALEAAFDDSTSPATASWRNLGTGGAPTTADPFLTMDQHRLPDGSVNERVWIAQLLAASSYMAHNESAGTSSTWTRSLTGPGQVHGVDNQSIAVGPYPNNQKPPTAAPGATYPHAMYYCSHAAVNAFCSRSDDGGLTFNPSRPIFAIQDACHNHGHVKVGADGTVYVPMNNSCQGHQGVSLSIDAGETWHFIQVPGTVNGRWDSSIAIASDGRTIYYGYGEEGDDRPMILKGTLNTTDPANPTIDWQVPAVDVGAPAGLKNIAFSTVVAGEPDRAAYIFHGTTTAGDSGTQAAFPPGAEWYLYVATTFDGGTTWELRNATPNDPTQKGSICDGGIDCDNVPDDRNLLDFMDADIDGEGRIVIGYADGCVDNCVTGGPNSYTARGYIARQASGQRMYAAFDPQDPGLLPGAPSLTATRSYQGASLGWTAPDSAAPITSYTVERATGDDAFRTLATAAGTATKYEDATAIVETASYRYRVTAANVHGSGPASNTVAPILPLDNVCVAPGLTVHNDAVGDVLSVATVLGQPVGAPAPQADLTLLTVSQPYLSGGALNLSFQLKTAGAGLGLTPDTAWFVSFRNAANVAYAVRMITDAAGAPRYESYRVAAGSNGSFRGDFVSGTPRPALSGSGYAPSTGLITIAVSASDVGVAAGGAIHTILAMSTKLVLVTNPVTGAQTGGSQPLDLMPDDGIGTGTVQTVAVGRCGPNQAPLAALSAASIGPRKQLNVRFDASRSSDPDASSSDPQLRDTIVKYVFDFGDGTAPVATTNPVIEHQYPQGGTYGARVRVQDSRGKASETEAIKQICEKCMKER